MGSRPHTPTQFFWEYPQAYVQGVSEPLRRCQEQQGVRTVFKSDTTLGSNLVRPKETVDPAKQHDVAYRSPCECAPQSLHRENKDIRLADTQTSAVSEQA